MIAGNSLNHTRRATHHDGLHVTNERANRSRYGIVTVSCGAFGCPPDLEDLRRRCGSARQVLREQKDPLVTLGVLAAGATKATMDASLASIGTIRGEPRYFRQTDGCLHLHPIAPVAAREKSGEGLARTAQPQSCSIEPRAR